MTIDHMLSASETRASSAARADQIIAFLRRYADERVNSALMDDRRSVTPAAILDLGKAGLFGLQVDQRYGGQGLTHADAYRVIAQATAMDTNLALIVGVHNAIGVTPISCFADEQTKAKVLPRVASGTSLSTLAVSEPGIGSNVQAMATTSTRVPDGYVVNGTKCWISLGAWADYVNLLTRTEDRDGNPAGFTAFLVEGGSEGFHPGAEAVTLGMKAFPQNRIDIRELRLPPEAVLGAEGQGMAVAQSAFYAGRGMLGAACVGVMKRSLQLTTRFAARRSVATGRLLDNGRVQQILSECMAATRAVEILVGEVAYELDLGREVSAELYSACKILSTELAFRVTDWSVQLLGARGYLDTNHVGQFFRDVRLLRIFEGATETLTVYLGSVIGKDPQTLAQLIGDRFQSREILELLGSAYGDVLAELPAAAKGSTAAYRDKQILAGVTGDLACWGVLAAMTEYTARRTGTELDQYTARWAALQLADRVSAARDGKRQFEVLDAAFLSGQVAAYESEIGDLQQSLAGEDRELDAMLVRS